MRPAVRFARAAVVVGLAAGCSKSPTVVPVRNLERPADMAFVCVAPFTEPGKQKVTGMPMAYCHAPSAADAPPGVESGETRNRGTFGLVTNTARGELAVVDMDLGILVDLDPGLPGYNMVPIGVFPDVISATQDGCRAVTANRGSCDLTLIDTQRLLAPTFGAGTGASTGDGNVVDRVVPLTGSRRPLHVAPREVAFLPQPWANLEPQSLSTDIRCAAEGAYAGPMAPRAPWRAVVTFPSCDLVATIEFPSGRILSSVYIRPGGVEDAGTEPVCPADCGSEVAARSDAGSPAVALPDAAAPDASGPIGGDGGGQVEGGAAPAPPVGVALTRPLRVGALAVLPDGSRAYVGAAGATFITALDITEAGMLVAPADGGRIPLHDDSGGVTRLRLSVDPFALARGAKFLGRFVGSRGEFLYAFAGDDSMRLIDVGRRNTARDRKERECDANVDPLFLDLEKVPPGPPAPIGCYALDDPETPPLRRLPLAQGPGIRIPTVFSPDVAPPVARDIAFANVRSSGVTASGAMDAVLNGAFGYVLSSNDTMFVLNVDPSVTTLLPENPKSAAVMNHTWVDYNLLTTPTSQGLPRVTAEPARNFMITDVPVPTRVPLTPLGGPRLEAVPVDPGDGSLLRTWVHFPDPRAATPQTWTLVWEGVLPGSDRTGSDVLAAGAGPGPAGAVSDPGADFCHIGVQARDVVMFPGCTQDTDCLPAGAAVCMQTSPGTPGLCFPATQAKDEALRARCDQHMGTRRRYEIVSASPQRLELRLKLDEVPKTTLDRCTTDQDCQVATSFAEFKCLQVRADEPRRCVKPCGVPDASGKLVKDDHRCRVGTICADIDGSIGPSVGALCVEGPPLDPACWPGRAPYRVQAGRSFVVNGSGTPRLPTTRTDEGAGQCLPDLQRNPLLVNRIPLDAPACANIPDDTASVTALTDVPRLIPQGPPGVWGNPCLFRAANGDDSTQPDVKHIKAVFENTQLRFIFTNLEQYAGDADISRFEVIGGFSPVTAEFPQEIIVTAGVRIITGPSEAPESPGTAGQLGVDYVSFPHLFVIDQGRTATTAGGRGQVLRISPRAGSYGIPRVDSTYSQFPFQIQ